MQELLRIGGVEVGGGDDGDAGCDALRHALAEEVIDEGLHSELAHAEGVLDHDAVELAVVHGLHEYVAGVEAEEADLAGLAGVLEREQGAGGGRFIGSEEAGGVAAVAIEEVLRRALRRVARGAGVLVRGDQLDALMLRNGVDESFLALLGAEHSLLIAKQEDLSFASQEAAHLLAGELAALGVVAGHAGG